MFKIESIGLDINKSTTYLQRRKYMTKSEDILKTKKESSI